MHSLRGMVLKPRWYRFPLYVPDRYAVVLFPDRDWWPHAWQAITRPLWDYALDFGLVDVDRTGWFRDARWFRTAPWRLKRSLWYWVREDVVRLTPRTAAGRLTLRVARWWVRR